MEAAKLVLAGAEDLQKEMERFFEHLRQWKRPVFMFEKAWKPRCDVSETDGEVIVVAELGGVDERSIDLRVEGSRLILKGVRPEPANVPGRRFLRMEINYGPFERVIEIERPVDAEKARASFGGGILEVRLPKSLSRGSSGVGTDVPAE